MNIYVPGTMTVDEFLRWSQQQDGGRFELEQGRIITMQAENLGHTRTKKRLADALEAAVLVSGKPFYAMPDGPTVRIPGQRAYEPDALLAPLPAPPDTALEIPDPIAVFEVLSPTPASIRRDLTAKLAGYALLPSIQHYVIVDPDERVVFRFRREAGQLVAAQELDETGVLRLDPPGVDVPVADMLVPKPGK